MAEKQLTTIEQLRALAERGKQDTLIRINELLDSMIPLLESAQHAGITVTLPAEKWSGRAQTVQDESSWLTANTGTLCAPTRTALWRQARPA